MGKLIACLFDFDGVIADTESQYSVFWHEMGVEFLGHDNLEGIIKGQTLTYIYNTYFEGMTSAQQQITAKLNAYEQQMRYDFIPGFEDFYEDLRRHDVRTAIVTSSNEQKMAAAYAYQPKLLTLFDGILTAEMFSRSKPAPDCYLLGMKHFGTTTENTYVFEDSLNGLRSGRASGAKVVGLSTTFAAMQVAPLCDVVLPDFKGFTYEQLLKV